MTIIANLIKLPKFLIITVLFLFFSSATLAEVTNNSISAAEYQSYTIERKLSHISPYLNGQAPSPELLPVLVDDLSSALDLEKITKLERKYAIYLLQIIGQSGQAQYIDILEDASESNNRKIRGAAKKYLNTLKTAVDETEFWKEIKPLAPVAGNIFLFEQMTKSSVAYTKKEGFNFLNTAHIARQTYSSSFHYMAQPFSFDELVQDINSPDKSRRIKTSKRIYYLGISDKRIHQKLAENLDSLVTQFNNASPNDPVLRRIDEISWLCKALAASGNAEYKVLLERAKNTGHEKIGFHASFSLASIDRFTLWYKRLAEAKQKPQLSEPDLHMLILGAPYLQIKDSALHYIIQTRQETPEVVDLCAETMWAEYPFVRRNARQVRPAARMFQIMARSGRPEFRELFQEAKKAPSRHLNEHAAAALSNLKKYHRKIYRTDLL